ncbi:hypothetical protein AVEN_155629-1 [Araneus ventricosus]|uniref:Mos1 transposase HTH domain-containing protein n=1 Tax=Araneus ventricosus TaxID=182803 RepID=A0A4Y2M7Y4_ARAVE|nr:hypothetical protein AVEN_155629-1 [Araneus ventricosus]
MLRFRLKEVYGEQFLSLFTIFRWCQRYEAGRVNTKDLPRPRQAHFVTNSATTSAVNELIGQNRRITTREFAAELSIIKGTVHHIIHKKHGYRKVCAQASVRESEDGENRCLPDPAVSTLKPSTPFLRSGISVSRSMAITYSSTVPHEL